MDWLSNMPEIPGGDDGHGCRTFNEEREADSGDDMPEIRDGFGGRFFLGRIWGDNPRGWRIAPYGEERREQRRRNGRES